MATESPVRGYTSFAIAVVVIILSHIAISNAKVVPKPYIDGDPDPNGPYAKDHLKEFRDFCTAQELSRDTPEKVDKDECKRIDERDYHPDDLNILFMVFLVLLYGAVIRSILVYFQVSLPYTVFMMASGMVVGFAAKYFCYEMHTYTAFARLNAKIYLFTFLPVLLFESSFGISGHVFWKAAGQVLLLAAPGMLMCTALTGFTCYIFFTAYEWTLLESMFYGSIISATDPVAVVAILKELGVAETLSVLVDGESLLNDGVAILLYEVIHGLLQESSHPRTTETIVGHVINDFFRIAIGGPCFGWFMAKIAIFCLSRVFNDAVVEITATLVATYLTYYIGEAILGVSGVMAVVLLGITMSNEKTCISPETEHEVHDFWGMLGHLANTVLFFITGIIITERGTRGVDWNDLYYLILLYCALNLIRFLMLMLFSPILSRIGYGLPWQNLVVMMWGGLRGAVGICLSLEVYEDKAFCKRPLGPKVLIQTAGIVFLTLVVNGTTTKKLLQVLKLTDVSAGRMEEMKNAVKTLHVAQKKALLMLRHDRFLADANWTYVSESTRIEDPYKDKHSLEPINAGTTSIVSLGPEQTVNECPECHIHVPNLPTKDELRDMTDEARLRVIKAMKFVVRVDCGASVTIGAPLPQPSHISYWAHFERGVLTEVAVQILAGVADTCSDKELYLIHTRDLKKYWQIRGVFPWLREQLVRHVGEGDSVYNVSVPPPPLQLWKRPFWWLATKSWFDYLVTVIVILNMIPAIWQLALESHYDPCRDKNAYLMKLDFIFKLINIGFTAIYLLEFVVKIIGLGVANYWNSKWNWVDATVLLVSAIDVVLSFLNLCSSGSHPGRGHTPLTPLLMDTVNGKINTQLFLGYDVALGFIMGCDDVLKFLPHMIDNKRVYNKIRNSIEKERMEAVREMGILQKSHPGIAVAIKTRHASRSVLNQMKSTLSDLRSDGLLDEKENDLLNIVLEERMKSLLFSPNYIPPPAPEVLLENLNWIYGHAELRDFIFENSTFLQYEVNDVICKAGDPPQGVYVIVSGMVRIRYEPSLEVKLEKEMFGVIPVMELFKDFEFDKPIEDLFSSGTVIGESACLTGRTRDASVICETEGVTVFHIPLSAMKKALETFTDQYNSLAERLWRSCGMRRASWLLPTNPFYQSYSKEKIETIIERSCAPIGPQFDVIRIPSYVVDVVVFEGWVEDLLTGELYIAPAVVPRTSSAIRMKPNPKTVNRVLVVLAEDKNPDEDDPDELAKCLMMARKHRRNSYDEKMSNEAKRNSMEPKDKQKRVSVAVNFGVRRASRKSIGSGITKRLSGRDSANNVSRRKSMSRRKSTT